MRTKIVNYNKNIHTTFDEQINEVLQELEDNGLTIKDIKVMTDKRVVILYSIYKINQQTNNNN